MKHRPITLGLVVALVMLLSMVTAAFADGETPPAQAVVAQPQPSAPATTPIQTLPAPIPPAIGKAVVCVDGYVINHREMPIDGTKFDPPLVVEALRSAPTATDTTAQAVQEGAYQAPVGPDGYFKFTNLPPGDWNFQVQLPPEWEGIVPKAEVGGLAQTGVTTFAEKKGCYRIVFKLRRLIDIVVVKWEEGLDGSVKPGVGWEITATPVNDPFVKPQTAKTDANGNAGFTLTPGQWIISEKLKAGYVNVTPIKLPLTLDQYSPPGARPPIVFKNKVPACYGTITVTKVGYGVYSDGSEAALGPLGGWQVTLKSVTNYVKPITLVTDAEGRAVFKNLPLGVYTVTETVQPGWKVRGANPYTVVVNQCINYDVPFDNEEIAGQLTIYGKKLFQAWVPPYKGQLVGLSGWTITATLVGTNKSISTTTDALGQYKFSAADLATAGIGFGGAAVQVCEEDRTNWIHVTPKCVTIKFPYPIPDTYKGVEVNFTNIQDPPPSGFAAPEGAAPASVSVASVCTAYHTVAPGDTLAKIASRYGVTMRSIITANGIHNADVIYLGQKICVQ